MTQIWITRRLAQYEAKQPQRDAELADRIRQVVKDHQSLGIDRWLGF